jgi:transcriptional regulator with GAF, ATPase, and Fis domain
MPSEPLANALGRIARIVSETLELKDVFARVGEVAASVLPFDGMALARADGPDTLVFHSYYSSIGAEHGAPMPFRLGDLSEKIRPPAEGVVNRIDDLAGVLDPSFPGDRMLLDKGRRSLLAVSLRRGDRLDGFVSVTSRQPRAFTEEHEDALRSIADLLGLALEHERLWNLDATRRRRLDAIDALLPMMANVLDVREIFNQISAVVNPVLPHARLMLTSLSEDRSVVTIDAISGEPIPDLPTTMPAKERCAGQEGLEYTLVRDTWAEADPGERTKVCRAFGALGIRSLLRIPFLLEGGLLGWLSFLSQAPDEYSEEDIVVARRVADHVSLALSHQRLAEEERRAAEARERAAHLEERVEALREELAATRGYGRIVGESKRWKEVLSQAARVAPTETTALLTGESGTGKEVVARFIHRGSPRAGGPFVAINCAALPETLLETELFGHERGAFTGAITTRAGAIEQAARGVLFLDEVAEMTPAVQAKFLRVLQEREFKRLGGNRAIKADVRVVAATNRDLKAAIARGEFREDLYYRLHVFEIDLPPLRERPDDILPLAEGFLDELGRVVGRPAAGVSREAREILLAYSWPGNVRELRNVLERATILCDGGLITAEHLPREIGRRAAVAAPAAAEADVFPAGGVDLEIAERDLIVKALKASPNNRSRAARLLGITRAQLYRKLAKHGLAAPRPNPASDSGAPAPVKVS